MLSLIQGHNLIGERNLPYYKILIFKNLEVKVEQLINQVHPVVGWFPQAATSVDGDYISLKGYAGVSIIIMLDVHTGTDAGAVALVQAVNVAGSGTTPKALGFDYVYANLDTEASDALVKTAVVSDTFNAGGVTKSCLYVIEVKAEDLDVDGGFDCLKVTLATTDTSNVAILYMLHTPRFIAQDGSHKSAIVD